MEINVLLDFTTVCSSYCMASHHVFELLTQALKYMKMFAQAQLSWLHDSTGNSHSQVALK